MPTVITYLWFAVGLLLSMTSAESLADNQSTSKDAQLAIIIDDIGNNLALGKRSADLPGNLTLAILPLTPHGAGLAERAHRRGKEIMLHIPMSNHRNYPLGPGGLTSNMEQVEFLAVLRQNLASTPHVRGVNNHMGSRLTEQAEPMRWLMQELLKHRLYFVDSRTSAQTQALIMAKRINLPSRKRDVFLDDERNSHQIHRQLIRALETAQQQGSAVAIGHPYPETLGVLEKLQPLLDRYHVRLVTVSALMPNAHPTKSTKKITACQAPPISLWPQIWLPIDPFNIDDLFKISYPDIYTP